MPRFPSPLRTLLLLTGFVIVAGTTAAHSQLRNEPTVTEGLINVAIAYEIGERCDSLDARRLAGINYLFALKTEAERLGYTEAEIDAFVDSDAEQDALEAIARGRLRDLGAVEGQWETYCTVGQAQIAQNTVAGQLLR